MLSKKYLTAAVYLIFCSPVFAQDSTQKGNFTLSGSADVYYRHSFNDAGGTGHTDNLTSFTNSSQSFELGMASLKGDYIKGKTEAVLDLGFGRRAEEFSYNERGGLTAIKQAYVSLAATDKLKFTMGKWATHVGYELLDAYLNRNYSMDYMFSYGPFFHTGLKADITLSKNAALMVGVSNPTDNVTASFSKKSLLGQLHLNTSDAKLNLYLNYVGGKDLPGNSINQYDAVFTAVLSSILNVGFNGTVKSVKAVNASKAQSWWGSAVYLNIDATSNFGLTFRAEHFDDSHGVAGLGTQIFDGTLSANIKVDNLTIIPEFRVDAGRTALFYSKSDVNSATAKTAPSFILAAVYHF